MRRLSYSALLRLSLVRFGASILVTYTTGVLNRILIAECGFSASIVSFILSLQNFASPLCIYSGFISDNFPLLGYRRSPHIYTWALLSCVTVPFMPKICMSINNGFSTFLLAIILFVLFGWGIKASNLMISALVAEELEGEERGEALNLIWAIAILGIVAAGIAFSWLIPKFDPGDPYDYEQMGLVLKWVVIGVIVITFIGTLNVETPLSKRQSSNKAFRYDLKKGITAIMNNSHARYFFAFLALADFSFFCQEFVLEAFGGQVYGLMLRETTSYNTYYGVGTLLTMIGVGALVSLFPGINKGRIITIGCLTGCLSFFLLTFSSFVDISCLILIASFLLGLGKGCYNVGISYMVMEMTDVSISGLIMGLWGAIGGFAVAAGGSGGGIIKDCVYHFTKNLPLSYGTVFFVELVGLMICLNFLKRFSMGDYRENLKRSLKNVFAAA